MLRRSVPSSMEKEPSVLEEGENNASPSGLISCASIVEPVIQRGVGAVDGPSSTAEVSSGESESEPAMQAAVQEIDDDIKPVTNMLAVLKNSSLQKGAIEESYKNDAKPEIDHSRCNDTKLNKLMAKLVAASVMVGSESTDVIREEVRGVSRKGVVATAADIAPHRHENNRQTSKIEEKETKEQAGRRQDICATVSEDVITQANTSDNNDEDDVHFMYHQMVEDRISSSFSVPYSSVSPRVVPTRRKIRPKALQTCEPPPVGDIYAHGKRNTEGNISPTSLRAIKEISLLKNSKTDKYSPTSDSSAESEGTPASGKHPRPQTGKQHTKSETSPVDLGELAHMVVSCSDVPESLHYKGSGSIVSNGLEHTGRWMKLEHSLFLKALRKYGREWKKVAAMVRTRTVVQTRTHAQKYFQKIQKSNQEGGELGEEELGLDFEQRNFKTAAYQEDDDDDSLRTLAEKPTTSRKRSKVAQPPGTCASTAKYRRRKKSSQYHESVCSDVMGGCDFGGGEEGSKKAVMPRQRMEAPQHSLLNANENEDDGEQQTSFPSPAACGKRKRMELAVAELLATAANCPITPRAGVPTHAPLRIETLDDTSGGFTLPTYYSTPWDGAIQHLLQETQNFPYPSLPTLSEKEPMLYKSVRNSAVGENCRPLKSEAVPSSHEGQQQHYAEKRQESPAVMERCYIPEPNNYQGGIKMGGRQVVNWEEQHQSSSGRGDHPHHERCAADDHAEGEGDKELHRLTIQGDVSVVQAWLESIHSEVGDIWVVKDLVNQRDKFGFTPLMCAASLERSPSVSLLVGLLLQYGANPITTDGVGNLPIHWAAYAGNESVVQLLLSHPYPPLLNTENIYGDTPLHFAARYAHVGVVEALLHAGSKYDARNADRRTALSVVGESITGDNLDKVSSAERDAVRKLLLSVGPKQRTLVLYHPDCSDHQPRSGIEWERPERVEDIICGIKNSELVHDYEVEISHDFNRVSAEALSLVHSVEYIIFVNNLSNVLKSESSQASVPFTPMVQRSVMGKENVDVKPTELCDTSFSAGTLRAARYAAGAVVRAVDSVVTGESRNAFCVVRPPGHHAGPNGLLDGVVSCGFCIFNNVVVGALHALEVHSVRRVAIVDLDVHHGNGTEELVREYAQLDRIMFFSVHLYDRPSEDNNNPSGGPPSGDEYQFFPGTGAAGDPSLGIINVPIMPIWKDDECSISSGTRSNKREKAKGGACEGLVGRLAFRKAIRQILLPALKLFKPDLIFLSTGFDALEMDVGNCKRMPSRVLQGCDLTIEDYSWATSVLQQVAEKCCDGRIVSVLEGGYGSFQEPCAKKNRKNESKNDSDEQLARPLDRTGLVEAAIVHLSALIDPYSVLIDKNEMP